MKTRVEKVLIQFDLAEPEEGLGTPGTVWKPGGRERTLALLKSCGEFWAGHCSTGPEPRVTITEEH